MKYDGEAVTEGTITFFPTGGTGGTAGGPIKDGKYSVTKVPVGTAKVSITGSKFQKMKDLYGKGGPQMAMTTNPLPPKYNDKTELTYDVKPGANEKDFDLPK